MLFLSIVLKSTDTFFFSLCHNILLWNQEHRNFFLIEQALAREKMFQLVLFI